MKIKSAFFCQNCGYESAKWTGKCPSCNQWNTFVEEKIQKDVPLRNQSWQQEKENGRNNIVNLSEVSAVEEERLLTPDVELNRVLGGGIVPGSLVLVGGEPGIGKSTLFLQNALHLKNITTLYVSGEESASQVKMRADRLQATNDQFYLLTETNTQTIFQEIKKLRPQLVVIDSIQTLQSPFIESAPGSVSQIRETAAEMQRFAKESHVPVFLIGHITKDGSIAGPKILEHMVDTVLQFEGDQHYAYRILRTIKNRFGSTAELGIYEMTGIGLRQVTNPSEILISQREDLLSGVAIASTMEGMRPMLIEVQALVTQSVYGTPQRTVTGFDLRRLQLLLAVLEKRGGFHFGVKDVFLNIAGGIRAEDPAIDLAVLCALLSSYEDIAIANKICFAGEVGLSGEIRAVNRIEQRIAEAEKLGFEKIFVSRYNKKGADFSKFNIEVIPVGRVDEVYSRLF
ncbi:DNA repair protein RadA [Chitinophaga sancti]|uniref:DNA repair protein RadA n=1 Tax=Chitinophaga sancti TaxID=1004 RepID=A0A1K1RH00_9BACT|nr:DNA repair protein RadA [Chitinophaga sancti]WQD60578.1 DNA repair protein RadA [Chitinophaga sancti]WQG87294.1 DNA repair protein RadA [Chitinophaga sancti]SFW71217.1 DNA repair protein RadA/Sms [Chitinophaga sancti]